MNLFHEASMHPGYMATSAFMGGSEDGVPPALMYKKINLMLYNVGGKVWGWG